MLHLSQSFIYKCYMRNNHQVYNIKRFQEDIRTILSISKKASKLEEICLDYITIHKDFSPKRHKHMRTCHKHLKFDCGICSMPFEADVFMYCSLNLSWWAISISLDLFWWTTSISLNLSVQQITISTWTSISWWPSIKTLASKGINRCVLAINTSGLTAASVSCCLRLR